ncbi:MAG: hypothetical protein J6I40_00210, partial [Mailhella sp.]|nr:hypothetical protein [Mailhella sp.]
MNKMLQYLFFCCAVLSLTLPLCGNALADNGELAGYWDDTTSGRCHMKCAYLGGGSYEITVDWADSAFVNNRWMFSVQRKEGESSMPYEEGEYVVRKSHDGGQGIHESIVYGDGTGRIF